MTLKETMNNAKSTSQAFRQRTRQRWGQVIEPLGSLEALEEDIIRVTTTSSNLVASLRPRATMVVCGDDGIVKEGVTQTGREVTAIVARDMVRGNSCVYLITRQAGADVIPVDVSMACHDVVPGVVNRKVAYGTEDFLEEPTVTMKETVGAMETDAGMVMELKEKGYILVGFGEMGIGNTATSNTLLSVLLSMDPELVTGREAGLIIAGYNREVRVIGEDIRIRKPPEKDPADALSKVDRLDLAALTGPYIGCAAYGLPVVLDGLMTGAATPVTARINPDAKGCLLVPHVSTEPVRVMILNAPGLRPAIPAGMCLGESIGTTTLLLLLDMATAMYTQMSSFDNIRVDAYGHLL